MSNQKLKEKPSFILQINSGILNSGFLAILKPEELETLIALCTFADEKGGFTISGKKLAQALDLCEKQAAIRLKRLCQKRTKKVSPEVKFRFFVEQRFFGLLERN